MSQLEVDKIIPQSGTTLTIGDSGDTITFADGAILGIDTDTLYIDSTNNRVGIGTSSPSTKLHLASGSSGASPATGTHFFLESSGDTQLCISSPNANTSNIRFGSPSDASGAIISYDDTNNILSLGGSSTNAFLRFVTGGASVERMRIDSSGNVGIGTSSPNNPQAVNLHISGTSSAIRMSDTTNSLTGNLYASGGEFSVLTSSSHPLVFKTGNSERMRINSSGNVGIGTTPSAWGSPFISGVTQFPKGSIACESNGIILFNNAYYDGTNYKYIASAGAGSYAQTSGLHIFNVASSGTAGNNITFSEAMRIDSSGDFMIGTTSEVLSDNTGTGSYLDISKGTLQIKASGNVPLLLNRVGSDGVIAQFRRDGVEVGNIGVIGGDIPYFGTTDGSQCGINLDGDNQRINPANGSGSAIDNQIDLGASPQRFKNLYLGGNIYLGGTGSANALDDYEEGTWTPSFEFSSAQPTAGNTTGTGFYTKVGNMVTVWGGVQNANVTGASGDVRIRDLPFTSKASANLSGWMGSMSLHQMTFTGYVNCDVEDGTNYIRPLENISGGNRDVLNVANCTDGATQVFFCINYQIN